MSRPAGDPSNSEEEELTVGLVVPAAGSGQRMGGLAKPFLELCGEPVLMRALRPFLDHPAVQEVIVSLHPIMPSPLPPG